MTSVITNDIAMTTIEKYIISSINSIKSKKQRADESSISEYVLKNFETNVNKNDIVERIVTLLKKKTLLSINNLIDCMFLSCHIRVRE